MDDLKHSGRRMFLKTVGAAAIGLPLLEFTHGTAHAQMMRVPKRFLTVFSHGGTISNQGRTRKYDGRGSNHGHDEWRAADRGEALVLGPIHQPLAAFRDKLLVLESIDNKAAIAQHQYRTGGHGTANVTVLTSADVTPGEDPVALGPSIDAVIAARLAQTQPVRFDNIHLEVRGHQYGTPYFRASGEAVSGEQDPRAAFRTIFAGVMPSTGPDPAYVKLQKRRGSVLDGALASFQRFKTRVSRSDLLVVDAHLEHLRALEQALDSPETAAACTPPTAPGTGGADVVGPLHARIIVAAMRCGLTNVANLEISDILTPWTPAGLRMDSAYDIGHSLGHYAREVGATGANAGQLDDWLAEMRDNRRWRTDLVRLILEGLDDPTFLEGGRTLLDNSVLLYTSEFSDPAGHMSVNTPVLLAGSAGGVLRTGRHLDYNTRAVADPNTLEYASDESLHNLYTSILQALGGTDTHFGSAHATHRGPLPGLT
jgi:hypothetical protein